MNRPLPHWAAVLAIALVVGVIYSNTRDAGFIFDDIPNIVDNRHTQISALDAESMWAAAFCSPSASRPVANVTFAWNHYWGGLDRAGYTFLNVAFHVANGALVYFLACHLFSSLAATTGTLDRSDQSGASESRCRATALLAGLIFVAHPLQIQSVTYAVQRMASLATMFCLLAWWLYVRGREARRWPGRSVWWLTAVVSWLCAMGSKQNAVIFPILLVAYELVFASATRRASGVFRGQESPMAGRNDRVGWKKRTLVQMSVVVLLIATLVGSAYVYLGPSPWKPLLYGYQLRDFTMAERGLTQLRVVVFYMSLVLFPSPQRLNLLHIISVSESVWDPPSTCWSLGLLIGLAVLAWGAARRHRLLSFCLIWFLAGLALESSVIALEMAYEHRLNLPLAGCSLLAAWGMHVLAGWGYRGWAIGLSFAAVLWLAVATYVRNGDWHDPVLLWTDVVAKSPLEPRAWNNRGKSYLLQERTAEAIRDFSEAIRLDPLLLEAYSNRGSSYALTGRPEDALADFTSAIQIHSGRAEAYNNRGIVQAQLEQFGSALADYNKALEISPDYADAHHNRGITLVNLERLDEAVAQFGAAIRLSPAHAKAYHMRGVAHQRLSQYKAALRDFSRSLELVPGQADVFYNRGITYGLQQDFAAAESDLSQVIKLTPSDVEARYNRGLTRARLGDLSGAIADYRHAIQIDPQHAGSLNNLAWIMATASDAKWRDGSAAVGHAQRACELSGWKNYRALRTLAAAYAELGQFDNAVRWQANAVTAAFGETRVQMHQLLQLYRQKQPYREPNGETR